MSGNHPETIEYYKDLLAERDDELDCLKESMSDNMSNNNVEIAAENERIQNLEKEVKIGKQDALDYKDKMDKKFTNQADKISKQDNVIQDLKEQMEAQIRGKIKDQANEIKRLEGNVKVLERKVKEGTNKGKNTKLLEELREKIRSLENANKKLSEEIKKVTTENNEMSKVLAGGDNNKSEDQKKKIAKLEEKVKKSEVKVKTLTSEKNEMEKQLAHVNGGNHMNDEALKKKISLLEADKERLDKKMKNQKVELKSKDEKSMTHIL